MLDVRVVVEEDEEDDGDLDEAGGGVAVAAVLAPDDAGEDASRWAAAVVAWLDFNFFLRRFLRS